jgi:hypothetical protein
MTQYRFDLTLRNSDTDRAECKYTFVKAFPSLDLATDYIHAISYANPLAEVISFGITAQGSWMDCKVECSLSDYARRPTEWHNEGKIDNFMAVGI